MLITEGEARTRDLDLKLACTLAAIAGALNTAVFHAVGLFTANMTGNVSTLSDRLALGDLTVCAGYLSIVLLFVTGAGCSSLLVERGRRRKAEGVYAYSILAEAVLLAVVGVAALRAPAGLRDPVLICGLSFLMGLQNAVVTRISSARVRTTHVSGMATDIGIELATLLDASRRRAEGADLASEKFKLRLHLETVASFVLGGVLGALAYRWIGDYMLLVTAALLFAIAAPPLLRLRMRRAAND